MTAFSETPAACAETTEWLLGNAAPDLRDRAERHLSHCTRCQTSKSRLEGLRAVAETTTPALDDLRRARMLAQLNPALDDLATRFAARARAPRGWPALVAGVRHRAGWLTAGLATLGLAAVAVVVISNNRAGGPGVDSTIAVGPYAIPRPETTPTPAASSTPKADAETRLVPFRITGLAPATTQNLLGGHFDKL
ncbi:MAG TPA: hypothetical protein VGG33_20460, partial [Polyangia bacterium]